MPEFENGRSVRERVRIPRVFAAGAVAGAAPAATERPGEARGRGGRVRFLIWGAGGHGRVVAELIQAAGGEVVGFMDAAADALGRVMMFEEAQLIGERPLAVALRGGAELPPAYDAVALGIGDNGLRMRCLAALPSVDVPPLVHPAAMVSPSAVLGRGSVVLAGAVVNTGARLGEGVIVNSRGVVEHDCVLADGVHVAPGAVLAGGVQVGERCWVGAGATVIENRTLGEGVLVGAGAVVIRDVPPECTVVGVPASRVLPRH